MVAIHDEKTIFPNFLRPANEDVSAVATTAPARTAAPTPVPTPTPQSAIILKAGVPVAYTDGWKVTVASSGAHPSSRFSTPKPGMQFIFVVVRYDNGTAKEASFNLFSWKMQDSNGVRRDPSFFNERDDKLGSGKLAPGGVRARVGRF